MFLYFRVYVFSVHIFIHNFIMGGICSWVYEFLFLCLCVAPFYIFLYMDIQIPWCTRVWAQAGCIGQQDDPWFGRQFDEGKRSRNVSVGGMICAVWM